jgi:prepilin-type N-terminal cleavage/methylation domain-containing protein/prepilin-type processing-associated H-X9-DG protein
MPQAPGRKAFTLVELLVVIGIIAVLIAILMPALDKARAAAKNAGCQANLHTIMQAVFEYANDNDGDLVPANWSISSEPNPSDYNGAQSYPTFWWEAPASDAVFLGKYTDNQKVTLSMATSNIWGNIAKRSSVWNCPEKNWGASGSSYDPTNTGTSYSMNQDGTSGTVSQETCPVIEYHTVSGNVVTGSTGWEYEYKLASVRSPSLMLCFACSQCERFSGDTNWFGNTAGICSNWNGGEPSCEYNLALRHPNHSTNISFMDGHVENVSASLYTTKVAGQTFTDWSLHQAFVDHVFVESPSAQ